jgi:ABC-type bacteriocin/lantibiotic exporter with double-glycine peptidase domain
MSNYRALELEAETLPEQLSTSWVDDARSFFTGFLFTAVMTVLGAALVTVALVVGVVGAPIIVAVVAYVIYRSRRAARERAWAVS